ncbi:MULTISPECIES: Ku protein [unclassified Streptomyces]|uniref:Ku protein n=1 Tax=unclassified Streptomyces TaxID=2593676 RepID=UPI0030C90319
MRALWSGVIQFGLVALPEKLFSATDEHPVRLREIHAPDSGRVQHRRFCEAEDREIPYQEVRRGWELPDDLVQQAVLRRPRRAAERPYALHVEALARTGQVGVCKVAVRSRERIALLRPRHGILILQTLLWQDELRDPGDLAPSAPVTDRELELAEVLMRDARGLSGGQPAAPPGPVPAVDLMAALQESVRAARAHQGN